MKEEPVACSDHHYEKLNASTIFCPGCGDMKSAPADPPAPAWSSLPRCATCGQWITYPHYHYWPGWTTWSSGTSGNVTIYPVTDKAEGTLT